MDPDPELSEKSDPEPDPDPENIFSAPTHCLLPWNTCGLHWQPWSI